MLVIRDLATAPGRGADRTQPLPRPPGSRPHTPTPRTSLRSALGARRTHRLVRMALSSGGRARGLAVLLGLVLVSAKEHRAHAGLASGAWSLSALAPALLRCRRAHSPSRTLRVGLNPSGALTTRSFASCASWAAFAAFASLSGMSSMWAPPSTCSSTCSLRCCMRSMSTSTPPSRAGASDSASASAYSSPVMFSDVLPPGGSMTLRDGRTGLPAASTASFFGSDGSAISAWRQLTVWRASSRRRGRARRRRSRPWTCGRTWRTLWVRREGRGRGRGARRRTGLCGRQQSETTRGRPGRLTSLEISVKLVLTETWHDLRNSRSERFEKTILSLRASVVPRVHRQGGQVVRWPGGQEPDARQLLTCPSSSCRSWRPWAVS